MKSIKNIKYCVFYSVFFLFTSSCNKNITDFGYDGNLSGTIKTPQGTIVAGDITSNSLYVQILGSSDIATTTLRVKGDGTYSNTKLFPTKYKIWITGAVTNQGEDTVLVDFSEQKKQVLDFVVLPYLTIKPPLVNGNPTATSINIDYDITANGNHATKTRKMYCGTYNYPNGTIGSGPSYTTNIVTLSSDKGTATVTGLNSKTKYYIRIGAVAEGASYENFSEQIIVTTP